MNNLPAKILDPLKEFAWERLYRLEIQKFKKSSAHASGGSVSGTWNRVALIYDVHDKTPSELVQDVSDALVGQVGEFRILTYYWEGPMTTPQSGRLMGKGQNFLYSSNPRGETISVARKAISINLRDRRIHLPDSELMELAKRSPEDLLQTIVFLDEMQKIGTLARALSSAYFCEDKSSISGKIKKYLNSEKEILREAAIEGLTGSREKDLIDKIKDMSKSDPSEFVKKLAREFMKETLDLK